MFETALKGSALETGDVLGVEAALEIVLLVVGGELAGELKADRILATQIEDKQPQPLFWSLEHGKGRVFVSIPGHYSWSFDDPLFRVLLLRGIAWSAHEPVDRFNDLVWPGADVTK